MSQPAPNLTSAAMTAGDVSSEQPSRSAIPARCLRCAADLSRLAESGRYCPQCGLDTYGSPPAALFARARESTLLTTTPEAEWHHLSDLLLDGDAVPAPPLLTAIPSPESSSQILRGYANAMYGLGRRYETGAGPARNRREAFRCYLKSARLGNVLAFARLANRWLQAHDSAAGPPAEAASVQHASDSPA